jgi:hypothetical protein
MMRQTPYYDTPEGATCKDCGELCEVVALLNEIDYDGSHCTNGNGGTYYPDNWGAPVSDCCEVEYSIEEVMK